MSAAFEGVTKRHGAVTALDGLTLDVGDGELLALVGPSGSGKSTALRVLAGLEMATGGRVAIDGREVSGLAPHRRRVAMVFQDDALYPHLSVRENLTFGPRVRREPAAAINERVTRVAALVGLEELLARYPDELSGGQRQRVALARAMLREPRVWLLDEPLSNLDAQLRLSARADIVALHRRLGITTIYVTHDQVEAMTVGDRVAVLAAGRLQQVGAPLEVYDAPANRFVASFLGSPPMNLVTGGGLLGGPPGTVVGIRPEDLHLSPGDRGETPRTPPAGAIEATVELVERLGSETLLTVAGGDGTRLRVRTGAHAPQGPGDRVRLLPDARRCHRFDAETGDRR